MIRGEAVTESMLCSFRELSKSSLQQFNEYESTETSICSTKIELNYETKNVYQDAVSADCQSLNEAIYIVDKNMCLLPSGLSEEIVIDGAGVAAAYLNMNSVTKSVFLSLTYAFEHFKCISE